MRRPTILSRLNAFWKGINQLLKDQYDVVYGKLRHLATYQATPEGRALRRLHTDFARFLSKKYRQAESSFAYAKGKNIQDCVSEHLYGSVFLKTDIHAYFDSISCDKMLEILQPLGVENDPEKLKLFTAACFYDEKLPLGFTSSPLLSDLFLVSLDKKYQKNQQITYTRYLNTAK